jgi:hypothetical protein
MRTSIRKLSTIASGNAVAATATRWPIDRAETRWAPGTINAPASGRTSPPTAPRRQSDTSS